MTDHFKLFAAAYVFLVKDGKILMLRRANTGYEDGNYSLPAGHADGNESMTMVAVRESKEEVGIDVTPHDLVLKTVMHRLTNREYIDFFFEVKNWRGEPRNMEPGKCDDLSWFSIDALPQNTIPYIREAIQCYREGLFYTEIGFVTNMNNQ